jgi:hypothetical protein
VKLKPLIITLLRYTSAEQGRRRHTPRYHTAGAGKANLFFSAAHQQICSSPAAIASWRRGSDLSATINYLRKTTSGATGIGLGAPG